MSIDISVTRPRQLPLARTFTEHLATNVAFDTLCLNISVATNERPLRALDTLIESESIPPSLVPLLSREWHEISELFETRSPAQLVRYGSSRLPIEGTLLRTLDDGALVISPSPEWLAEEIRMIEHDARERKTDGFVVKSLRDMFWYQFEVMSRVIGKALRLKRGIHLS